MRHVRLSVSPFYLAMVDLITLAIRGVEDVNRSSMLEVSVAASQSTLSSDN